VLNDGEQFAVWQKESEEVNDKLHSINISAKNSNADVLTNMEYQ